MTEKVNVVSDLQGLIDRQFSYMPSIVKKEMHEDMLVRMGDWLITHTSCGKKSKNKSIKHMEEIEDFFQSRKIDNPLMDRVSNLFDRIEKWSKK